MSSKRGAALFTLLVIVGVGWRLLAPRPASRHGGPGTPPVASDSPRLPDGDRSSAQPLPDRHIPAADRARPPPAATEVRPSSATGEVPAPPLHSMAEQAEANRRSVREAIDTGRFPERLQPSVAPRPFDPAAFKAAPQAYLDVVEPGRAYQTAPAVLGTRTLDVVGDWYLEATPGQGVVLAVQGEPLAPVSFTCRNMGGTFENGLASVTVRSDAGGHASTTFTLFPGTVDPVYILAGSPVTMGQVNFQIAPKPP